MSVSANFACSALLSRCLSRQEIPQSVRTQVARACVHSKGLHLAGSWPLLKKRQFEKVALAFHRPYRVIAGARKPPQPEHVNTPNIVFRRLLAALPLEWGLVLARLAQAARMSGGSRFIVALVQGPGGDRRRAAVRWSLKALSLLPSAKLRGLPCPLAEPGQWDAL